MGEILFSVCVGLLLVISGAWMFCYLRKEEKRNEEEKLRKTEEENK